MRITPVLIAGGTLLLFFSSVSAQTDETIIEKATGKDVTEATIRKLNRAQIFSEDYNFFLRLAYVESRFGTWNETFNPPSYTGGIWRVDEQFYHATIQTNTTEMIGLRNKIEMALGINWLVTTWNDLLKPLHSLLAARLYFASRQQVIPQSISQQAALWKQNYREDGDLNRFINDSIDLGGSQRCRGKMDLCIVLDSSNSIFPPDYTLAKRFVADMIESFTLDQTRLGMLVYSDRVVDIFPVKNNLTIEEMSSKALAAIHLKENTRTDWGIIRAVGMLEEAEFVEGVPRIVVILTDGQANNEANLTAAVEFMKRADAKPISVGIGAGVNYQELLYIALNDSRSVFEIGDFEALQDFLFQLTSVTCEIHQRPEINGTYEDSLLKEERRYYMIDVPQDGLTILLEAGNVVGYWSYTDELPNSAFNDGELGRFTFIPGPSEGNEKFGKDGDLVAASASTVYFSIEGVEEMNDYKIFICGLEVTQCIWPSFRHL